MGKNSFALNVFLDQLFTSLEMIISLGNIYFCFPWFVSFLRDNNSILPNSWHVPMEDHGVVHKLSWGCNCA